MAGRSNAIHLEIDGAIRVATAFADTADIFADSQVEWAVGSPVSYSIYQELGTIYHPPQPYLIPAANEIAVNVEMYVASSPDLETAIARMAYDLEASAKRKAPVRTGKLRDSIEAERRQ